MAARDPALSLADNRRLLHQSRISITKAQHNYTAQHPPPPNTPSRRPSQIAKMSGSAQGTADMKKAAVSDTIKNGEQPLNADKKPAAQLEEDDEFEDFPVEGASLP
jgi:hypothetical protein